MGVNFIIGEWMDGWKEGWKDGRESGVKDCLQQSKIKVLKIMSRKL